MPLNPVLSVALVLAIYGITTLARGSGFLAIYIAGLVLGNATFIHRRTLMLFHDGLAWLMRRRRWTRWLEAIRWTTCGF